MKNKKRILFLFLVVVIISTISAIATGEFFTRKITVGIGEISPQTVLAPFKIENEIATRRKIQAIEDEVEAVYVVDETIQQEAISNVQGLFESTRVVKDIYTRIGEVPLLSTGIEEHYGMIEDIQADPVKTLQMISTIPLYREEYEILLEATAKELDELEEVIINILETLYEGGIEDVQVKSQQVRSEVERAGVSVNFSKLAYEVIASQLMVNLIIDEEATQIAKQEAVSDVEPIYVLENEKIIDEGSRITEEAYLLLEKSGYLNAEQGTNITQYVGIIIIIAIATIFGVMGLNSVENGKVFEEKAYRRISLLVILYMISLTFIMFFSSNYFIYMPLGFAPMLIAILMKKNIAIVFNLALVILASLVQKVDTIDIIYFLITGSTSIWIVAQMQQRKQTMRTAAIIGVMNGLVYIGLRLIIGVPFSVEILLVGSQCALVGVLTVVLAVGSLPLWEASFGFITPFQLLELTNPNQPILKRMLLEATGTYYHSLLVANLAETAADDIGANPLLARVGGYYHDIGKLSSVNYFKENQVLENPHEYLDPRASAGIIISHVTGGLEIAEEYKLPQCVKDMIIQHHGRSTMQYFYVKASEIEDNEVSQEDFTYPGPRPQTKEAGLVMLADVVEATVRSMQHKIGKEISVEDIVRKMVKQKVDEGELNECPLYMSDIEKVIQSFTRMLKGMYHERIEYPEKKGKTK